MVGTPALLFLDKRRPETIRGVERVNLWFHNRSQSVETVRGIHVKGGLISADDTTKRHHCTSKYTLENCMLRKQRWIGTEDWITLEWCRGGWIH
jgi:hypothetical protein